MIEMHQKTSVLIHTFIHGGLVVEVELSVGDGRLIGCEDSIERKN